MSWNANLSIDYRADERRTSIARIHHQGPLMVQKSFYPDASGIVHNYILHPPGGLAGGDQLDLSIRLQANANVLLTTPASGKVYRTPDRSSQVDYRFELAKDARLYWLPQENIVFDGAFHRAKTEVHLQKSSHFTGWDITCLGRPGAGENFAIGQLFTQLQLIEEKKPIFLDRLLIEGGSELLRKPWGLDGHCAYGTMVLHWPQQKPEVESMGEHSADGVELALTRRDAWLVARARAPCSLRLKQKLLKTLQELSMFHYGTFITLPRIWQY